jgi:hypothetical protein
MGLDRSFQFADEDLNRRLIALLKKKRIPHRIDRDGVIHYSANDELAVENDLICSLRDTVFSKWQILSFPKEWADVYRRYMTQHGIPFKEELHQGDLWLLLPRKYRPHQWKLDDPVTSTTVVGATARRL